MAENSKEAVYRRRHFNVLKSTIERAEQLNAEADTSFVMIFASELEAGWSNYSNAFNTHEDSLIGKDDTTLNTISKEFTSMHNSYLNTKLHLAKLDTANHAGASNSTLLNATAHNSIKTTKLPPIKITQFTGDLKHWTEFKATCRSVLIDKIPDVQRLQYLKDALIGEPRELVSHILPAEGAYDRAMKLLTKRYENVRAMVNNHLRQIFALEKDRSPNESISLLRKIINTINGLVAALLGFDIDAATWDSILIFNTSQCLHPDSFRAWEEQLQGQRNVPSLDTYLNFLDMRVTILENTASFSTFIEQPNRPRMVDTSLNSYPICDTTEEKPSQSYFIVKDDVKCWICNGNHLSNRCNTIRRIPVQNRRALVQKSGACINCLQAHPLSSCPFEPSCQACSGNHNTLLHGGETKMLLTQDEENSAGEGASLVATISTDHQSQC